MEKTKVGPHRHNFSPAMLDWRVFLDNKRCSMQKKEIFEKLIYSIETNMITSFFSKFSFKFLTNSIKYVVSRAISGALNRSSHQSCSARKGVLKAPVPQSLFSSTTRAFYSALWKINLVCTVNRCSSSPTILKNVL